MGLLKAIKYSTFEVSVLNEIVDKWIVRMNISGFDLTRFCIALIGQTRSKKGQNELLGRKDTVEIMKMLRTLE